MNSFIYLSNISTKYVFFLCQFLRRGTSRIWVRTRVIVSTSLCPGPDYLNSAPQHWKNVRQVRRYNFTHVTGTCFSLRNFLISRSISTSPTTWTTKIKTYRYRSNYRNDKNLLYGKEEIYPPLAAFPCVVPRADSDHEDCSRPAWKYRSNLPRITLEIKHQIGGL